MAKVTIVFEDVNPADNEGKPIAVSLTSNRATDCQGEPTLAEMAAQGFYDLVSDASMFEGNDEAL